MRRTWVVAVIVAAGALACLAPAAWADGLKPDPDPQGSYVIRKGDTLWGIARERFQDPFRWPTIWERNPFIADPNLIFPGDTLMLPGAAGLQAPRPAATGTEVGETAPKPASAAAAEAPAPSPAETAAPAIVPIEAKEPVASPPSPVQPAPTAAAGPARVPPASPSTVTCSPVLASDTQLGIGQIVRGFEDRLLLSREDRVFVGLPPGSSVRVGDRLAAVRRGRLIAHPANGRPLGRIVDTLGVLEVLEARDGVALAVIRDVCDSIEVGSPVIPFSPAAWPATAPIPSARAVEGMIVGAFRSEQMLALQQTIFLDLGAEKGVGIGDVFAIYRPSLPAVTATASYPIPPERLGEAVILRVTDNTATALITASAKESRVGDRAVLSLQAKP